jgi:hypothetical protein
MLLLLLLQLPHDSHVHFVVVIYLQPEGACLCLTECVNLAKHLALLIHAHADVVERVLYAVTTQHFTCTACKAASQVQQSCLKQQQYSKTASR